MSLGTAPRRTRQPA